MKPNLAARLLILLALFFVANAIRAANQPPERFLAFPDLTLARGETSAPIPLTDHLRDPDVPGTAARITVRLAGQTRTIDLALHDAEAPLTVANFVAYVNAGRYAANFFHRSVPGFIIQNGGYYFLNDTTFDQVPTYAAVKNEPGRSNLRGTVAMAKLGGDPDSATSQWFINLADNSANLDAQNGGFTVFAHVLGDGMTVAGGIAATPRYDATGFDSAWTDLPLTTGDLARANFIETSTAIVPALSHTVTSDDPTLVSASIENGALRLTASATRSGTTTIRLVTADLEGGTLVSTFSVAVSDSKPAISAGLNHSIFLKTEGTVWATGYNGSGQLGDGSTSSRSTPVQVLSGVSAISAGHVHSLFLKTDGTLWATGRNVEGQLGDGSTTNRNTPVQVLSGVSAISAGETHSLFLKTDGTVWATGYNGAGQLGDGSKTNQSTPVQVMSGVSAISAGVYHSLFLKTDGSVWATGYNYGGQLGDGSTSSRSTPVQVLSGVSAISAGVYHSLFLKTDGSVWATGANDSGQLGDGSTSSRSTPVQVLSGVSAISAGYTHSLFLKTDGTVWATGYNYYGQLGDGSTSSRSTPVQVLSGVSAISAGVFHSLFLKTDGTFWATGANDWGPFGDGTEVSRSTPVQIKFPQTISFTPPQSATFGDAPLTLSATATTGLPVTFTVASGPATISGNLLTITGAGSVVIRATQAGDAEYSAAPSIEGTITVAKADQTITFTPPTSATLGESPLTLSASANSGLRVGYTVVSGPATIFGNQLTLTGAGSVVIRATQAGDNNHNAAPSVERTLAVAKAAQSIAFTPPASATFGDAPLTLSATASSGLPVTFSLVYGAATLSGNTLTLTDAGTVVIRATQAGNNTYEAAPAIERTIIIAKKSQTITFNPIADRVYDPANNSLTLYATASSGMIPVLFNVISGPAFIGKFFDVLVITGTGPITVQAYESGNANYDAASATRTFTVAKADQTITFTPPASAALGDNPVNLSASATSGLPVAFTLVSGPATLSGSTLTFTGVGNVAIRATQGGGINYNPAPAVERTLTVGQVANAQITLAARTVTYTGAPHPALAVTTPAGLRVTYTYQLGTAPAVSTAPTLPGVYKVIATLDDPSASNKPTTSSTLTITKAPLTIAAPVLTRAVGIANPSYSLSYSGLVGTDTPATALTRPPVAATKANASSAPGTYPITLTGGVSSNYSLTLVPGTLTVVGFGGTYEALLLDESSLPAGKLTLTVPANALSYTGTLTLAREAKAIPVKSSGTTAFIGSTDLANASATWTRTTNGPDDLSLALTLTADGFLAGSLDRNDKPFATLARGARLRTFAKGETAPGAGANTLALHPAYTLSDSEGSTPRSSLLAPRSFPHGSGFATAPIAPTTGVLTLKGFTADGLPLTASLKPTLDDTYLLWVNPYGTRTESFLAGALPLQAHPESTRFPGRAYISRDAGLLTWQKAALPANTATAKLDKSYRAGFGPLGVEVSLDPWLPPSARASGAIPAATLAQRLGLATSATSSGAMSLYHGSDDLDLGARETLLPAAATLSPAGVLTATNAAATAWTIKITPATGAFTGTFTLRDPAPTPAKPSATVDRKVTFSGVLRQAPSGDNEVATGFFLVPGFPVPKGSAPTEQPSGEIRFSAP
jgi:alpha-tubulin suppressor-like RCC1 family protein/cyclophilin family peptidyl-prolyl cis-trans isomerase